MAAEVELIFNAQDNASPVMGGLGNTLSNFGNIVTGIKSAFDLIGGAVDAAVGLFTPFVDAASESEQAISKLNVVLNSTGNQSGFSSQQLQNMALAMQNLSGFSDEAEMAAEAMLLRFENLNGIFPQALQLTNDLAISLGIDLTTAAQTIGKALDDPASGIGRLNTQFKLFNDTEMTTIKQMAENGDIAGAQALIMDRLREKVGGAAEAFGNTFAGKLAIAKEALDNIKETIGTAVLPILSSLLDKFMEFTNKPEIQAFFAGLADSFKNFPNEPLKTLVDIFQKLWTTLQSIPEFQKVIDFFTTLGSLFAAGGTVAMIIPVLQEIVAKLPLLSIFISLLNDLFGPFVAILGGVGIGFGTILASVAPLVLAFGGLSLALQILHDKTGGLVPTMGELITKIDEKVSGIINTIADRITTWANGTGPQELANTLISFIDKFGTGPEFDLKIKGAINTLFTALTLAAQKIDDSVIGQLTNAIDAKLADGINKHDWKASGESFAKSVIKSLQDGLGQPLDINVNIPDDWLFKIFAIGPAVQRIIDFFKNSQTGQAIVDAVSGWFSGVGSAISQAWNNINWTSLRNAITNSFHDLAVNAWQGFVNELYTIESKLENWAKNYIIDPIKRVLGIASPSTVFRDIAKEIVNGLVQGWNNTIGNFFGVIDKWIQDIWDRLPGWLQELIGGKDASGLGTAGGGTSGGGTGGGTGGGSDTGTNTNNYYFYGTVNFYNGSGGGSGDGTYECLPTSIDIGGQGGGSTGSAGGGTGSGGHIR